MFRGGVVARGAGGPISSKERGGVDTYERMLDHLKKNEVSLAEYPLTHGPTLKMNPKTERFTNNEAANKLLTRNYRKPFVVPKNV